MKRDGILGSHSADIKVWKGIRHFFLNFKPHTELPTTNNPKKETIRPFKSLSGVVGKVVEKSLAKVTIPKPHKKVGG